MNEERNTNLRHALHIPKKPCFQPGFLVLVRHVVTKHRSDLHISPNLLVHSNGTPSWVGAILLVSCTLQTRALVHTPRRNSAKYDLQYRYLVLKYEKNHWCTFLTTSNHSRMFGKFSINNTEVTSSRIFRHYLSVRPFSPCDQTLKAE